MFTGTGSDHEDAHRLTLIRRRGVEPTDT
jgi:hypothetical protein